MLVLAIVAFTAQALSAQALNSRYHKTLDTITNTGAKTMTSTVKLTGPGESVVITTANTTLTGTMGGIGRLWGSNDGIKYQRVRTYQLHQLQVDSCVIDAAHPNFAWVVDHSPFAWYQVIITGVGTSTYTTQGGVVKH